MREQSTVPVSFSTAQRVDAATGSGTDGGSATGRGVGRGASVATGGGTYTVAMPPGVVGTGLWLQP
jgi:hypothetical protein